jgi:hypothetical protein
MSEPTLWSGRGAPSVRADGGDVPRPSGSARRARRRPARARRMDRGRQCGAQGARRADGSEAPRRDRAVHRRHPGALAVRARAADREKASSSTIRRRLAGSFSDRQRTENAFHRALELRPLVAGVGVELDQEREGAEQVLLAFRRRLLTGSPRPRSGQATRRQAQRHGSATGCGAKGLPI